MVTVFLLGASGYLGGAILDDLVKHRKSLANLVKHSDKEIQITALVRKDDHIKIIKDHIKVICKSEPKVVNIVKGDFSNEKLITQHSRTADITINAAGSDNVELTEAILAGQKARVVEDKKERAALLHTSGVAVFAGKERDGSHNKKSYVWNDSNEADIKAINVNMLHGPVDELILRKSEEGDTESYIVCPGAIFGPSTGPVPTASLFYKFITKLALSYNRVVYIGEGTNVFYAVILKDLIRLYRLVFERILSREFAKESPYTRYYLGTSTQLEWKDIAASFGKTLKEMGEVEVKEPMSITVDSLIIDDEPPSEELLVYTSASQNVEAERAKKALGWEASPVVLSDWVKAEYVKVAVQAAKQKKVDP